MIKIICIGKIKEKYLQEAIKDYQKRLSKYTKFEIIELNNYNSDNIDLIKKEEAKLINKYINPKDYVICLDLNGKQLTSVELSDKIDDTFNNYSNITFIIGGSYGIDKSILESANYKLSFSKLTFPHQLFRVMLMEQIYRAFKIKNNESYHK